MDLLCNKYREYLLLTIKKSESDIDSICLEAGSAIWLNRFGSAVLKAISSHEKLIEVPLDVFIATEIENFVRNTRHNNSNVNNYLTIINRFSSHIHEITELEDCDETSLQYFKTITLAAVDILLQSILNFKPSIKHEDEHSYMPGTSNVSDINNGDLYKKLFGNVPIPIVILDGNFCVFNYNESAQRIFSFISPGIKFLTHELVNQNKNRILYHHITRLSSEQKEQVKFDSYLDTASGSRFFRIIIKRLHVPQVRFHGLMIALDDLTNRKKIEQNLEEAKQKAEDADKLKTAFLANMSHEIRTPMNAIVGFSELLLSSHPSREETKEYLTLIKKSGRDLLNIIDDIIDVAKIEARQLKIKRKPCEAYSLMKDLKKVYDEQFTRIGIEDIDLILNVKEGHKDIVFQTDAERLKQVMSNLLNNAIKFTEKGYIEFGYIGGENSIRFYVKDTGIGIPPKMRSKIFDRFVQVEEHYEKNTGGTGLGLTISNNIIKLLGGRISVDSELDSGSHFYFDLPCEKLNPALHHSSDMGTTELPVKDNTPNFSSSTILIAEDEESNYLYLHEILKKTNATLIWARNGLEAINQAESNDSINLILMDIKMPEVSGLEAVKYISNIRPELPIIAQTANAMDNDKVVCLKAGCVDYISKPINKSVLLLMVSKYLKKEVISIG